jgi:serine/threonine-protein kinase CTR1
MADHDDYEDDFEEFDEEGKDNEEGKCAEDGKQSEPADEGEGKQGEPRDGEEEKAADEIDEDAGGAGWTEIDYADIELLDNIGGGGVGLVYNGRYQGEDVALKTLFDPRVDADLKQEFMDELLIMSQLDHPNIVKLYGASMKAPNLCIVMELCEMSLFQLLHNTNQQLSTRQKVDMLMGTASSMHYLHTRKPPIIHRDLKSHNLLVAETQDSFEVKLCDFGLVRTKVTAAGTPAYMAAELLQNKTFSKKVDVYAFGILMWEVFEESVPFAELMVSEIRDCVVAGQRPDIPQSMPPDLQRLMQECWSNDPEDRPDFMDVICDLREALDSGACDPIVSNLDQLELDMGGDCLDSLGSLMGSPKHK